MKQTGPILRKGTKAKPSRRREVVKDAQPTEYVLLMTPRYNEQQKRTVTYVALRTTKEFSNFRYEIVVESRLERRTLRFDIRGLRAPELTLPGFGPAIFEAEYTDLSGSYEVIVTKLRKDVNVFQVHVSPNKIVVERSPESKFVDLITQMEDW